jgi:predicted RNA-binding Zn-ribbon protein involved in translation (DUF1610 family)
MLNDADYRLSMIIGRRKKDRAAEAKLNTRTLLVHRLRSGAKAVLRMPMSRNLATSCLYTIHCEPCARWFDCESTGEQFECPSCGGVFVLEFSVFTRLDTNN